MVLLETLTLTLLLLAFLGRDSHTADLSSFALTALLSGPKFWDDRLLGANDLEGVDGHNRK